MKAAFASGREREELEDLRHSVRRRLERIELLLAWDGEVRRSDITNFFNVSEQQASSDISLYKDFAPYNLIYDTRSKRYLTSEKFEPFFLDLSADRFLSQMRFLGEEIIEQDQTWFRQPPSFDIVSNLNGELDSSLLRDIVLAIRERYSIEVKYQSMSRPTPTPRRIAPHSLAFNGRRWHVRAWCFKREQFRDFVLSRFLSASVAELSDISSDSDADWNTYRDVIVRPHQELSEPQQKAVSRDYGLRRGRSKLRIRQALLMYFVDFYRLDPRVFGKLSPEHLQIQLENWDELEDHIPELK